MAKLYNAQTRQPDPLEFDQVEEAIKAGTHTYKTDDEVDVIDPSGKSFKIAGKDLKDAIDEGYKLETPEQIAIREYKKEHTGFKGQSRALIDAALNEAAFGTLDPIREAIDPLDAAKSQALRDENTAANVIGSGLGFAASLLYGGPLLRAGTAAGKAAAAGVRVGEKALAKSLVERGVSTRMANRVSGTLVSKTLQKGAELGVEGMVQLAPRAITEAAVTGFSPEGIEEAAETLFVDGLGFGSALGMGWGGLKAVSKSAKKVGTRAAGVLEPKAASEALAAEKAIQDAELAIDPTVALEQAKKETKEQFTEAGAQLIGKGSKIVQDAIDQGASPEFSFSLLDAVQKKKADAKLIEDAYEKLNPGQKPLDYMTSESDLVARTTGLLSNKANEAGIELRKKLKQDQLLIGQNFAKSLGKENMDEIIQPSAASFADGIANKLEEYSDDLFGGSREIYQEINKKFPMLKVPNVLKKDLINEISGMRVLKTAPSSESAKFLRSVLADAPLQERLHDLKDFRTRLRRDYYSGVASPEMKNTASEVMQLITDLEKRTLEGYAEHAGTPELKTFYEDLLTKRKMADRAWASGQSTITEIAQALGIKKKISRPEDLAEIAKGKDPTTLINAVLGIRDARKLQWLQTNMPEVVEMALEYKRMDLLNKARASGKKGIQYFNNNTIVSELEKLSPELRKAVIKDAELYDAAKTVFGASHGTNINPSGTYLTKLMDDEFEDRSFKFGSFKEAFSSLIGDKITEATASLPSMAKNLEEMSSLMRTQAQKAGQGVMPSLVEKFNKVEGVLQTERAMKAVASKLDFIPKAINYYIDRAKENWKPGARGLILRKLDQMDDEEEFKKSKKIQRAIEKAKYDLNSYDPDWKGAVNFMRDNGVPNVAARYEQKVIDAVNYLDSVAPKDPRGPNILVKTEYQPSAQEASRFLRRVEAAIDPLSIIDRLADNTISKEHVETVKALTPALYAKMQKQIFQALSDRETTVPYQARLRLSSLFGIPLDSSLGKVPQLQQTFENQAQQKMRASGLNKLDVASASQTEVQRLGG